MLDRVLIAAHGPADQIRRRVDALARWYGVAAEVREVAGGAVTIAALGAPLRRAVFGEAPPRTLDLLAAADGDLRGYAAGGAALAAASDRARLVAGAGAPALLYGAATRDPGEGAAWSTHAVAAAYVATGAAAVDPAALPEQVTAEFVGDERSLVAGVRALPTASYVELAAGGGRECCYWPPRERWRLLDPADAHDHIERHLLESLSERLEGVERPMIGLTAGYDSRVAALALRELGVPAEGYTWGAPGSEDVTGAAAAAAALDMPHRHLPFDLPGAGEALSRTRASAVWAEGAIHVGIGGIVWPDDMRTFVTGAGGETGRCFYYADRAGTEPPANLARTLSETLAGHIADVRPDRIEDLHARVRGWVAAAERAGVDGWRVLDVVYAEQRVRRWLRGMLPHMSAPMVGAFVAPEVQRGLVSLTLEQRATSGFHRRFIADRDPDLLPPVPEPAPVPSRRPIARALRRLWRTGLGADWTGRPEYRDWIADGVLGSGLAMEGMGERWCRRTRSRFLSGEPVAVERALWLGGPIALSEALRDLPRA